MSITRERFSKRQAGRGIAVDVMAVSPQVRTDYFNFSSIAAVVVQATTYYLTVPVPFSATNGNAAAAGVRVTGAEVNFQTAPVSAAGTATIQIDRVATGGGTTTNIVAATNLLTRTAQTPFKLTLAATNPAAIVPGDLIMVTIATQL